MLFSAPVSLTIGASGAVYGLMGALLVTFKRLGYDLRQLHRGHRDQHLGHVPVPRHLLAGPPGRAGGRRDRRRRDGLPAAGRPGGPGSGAPWSGCCVVLAALLLVPRRADRRVVLRLPGRRDQLRPGARVGLTAGRSGQSSGRSSLRCAAGSSAARSSSAAPCHQRRSTGPTCRVGAELGAAEDQQVVVDQVDLDGRAGQRPAAGCPLRCDRAHRLPSRPAASAADSAAASPSGPTLQPAAWPRSPGRRARRATTSTATTRSAGAMPTHRPARPRRPPPAPSATSTARWPTRSGTPGREIGPRSSRRTRSGRLCTGVVHIGDESHGVVRCPGGVRRPTRG